MAAACSTCLSASVITFAGGNSVVSNGADTASVSLSIPSPGIGVVSATATAAYGRLYVAAYANTGGPSIGYASAYSGAEFDDTVLMTGGVGDGRVQATVGVFCCGFYDGTGYGRFQIGSAVGSIYSRSQQSLVLTTPFTFGVPFSMSGIVRATATDWAPNDPNYGASDGAAGLQLSSLLAFDASGQPLAGYFYSSDSASQYPFQNGVFVPEPGIGIITLFGLFVILALRKAIPAPRSY